MIAPRIMLGLDVDRSDLAAVLSGVQIGTRPIVRVIKTKTRWARSECNPPHPVRRNKRCTFFRSAIHVSGNHLAVPMQLLGSVRVVADFYAHGLPLFKTEDRSWELTVIGYRRNDVLRSDLNRACGNAQDVIRRAPFGLLESSRQTEARPAGKQRSKRGSSG